jgi:hypothetical protein
MELVSKKRHANYRVSNSGLIGQAALVPSMPTHQNEILERGGLPAITCAMFVAR